MGRVLVGHEREHVALVRELAREGGGPDAEPDRDPGGCGRRRGEGGRGPAAPQRDDVGALGERSGDDPVAEIVRRRGALREVRERRGGFLQPAEILPAARAVPQVLLVRPLLVGIERVERVGGGQLVDLGFHWCPSWAASASSSRMRARPANIRDLIVPSGWPSLSASSDCVNPP